MDRKRSENGHFLRRIVFTFPLGFADVFGQRSYPKRPKNAFFLARRPIPKVLMMRWKVLTSETPKKYEFVDARVHVGVTIFAHFLTLFEGCDLPQCFSPSLLFSFSPSLSSLLSSHTDLASFKQKKNQTRKS